jgi:N-glycosylase/DNA lyase
VLTALVLGLSDYRLGRGGADAYWRAAADELDAQEPRQKEEVIAFIDRLLGHPVAALDADRKRARILRLLASGVPGWLDSQAPTELVGRLSELWQRLAAAMRQEPSAKTIVFAIKLVDLMCFQATGRRAELGEAPIAVDIRVARASLASGVVMPVSAVPVGDLLRLSSEQLLATQEPYLQAWNRVASFTDRSPLALDSLVWQAAAHVGPGASHGETTDAIEEMLRRYGATGDASRRVAKELAAELDQ